MSILARREAMHEHGGQALGIGRGRLTVANHEEKVERAVHDVEHLLDIEALRQETLVLELLQALSRKRAAGLDPMGEEGRFHLRIVLCGGDHGRQQPPVTSGQDPGELAQMNRHILFERGGFPQRQFRRDVSTKASMMTATLFGHQR